MRVLHATGNQQLVKVYRSPERPKRLETGLADQGVLILRSNAGQRTDPRFKDKKHVAVSLEQAARELISNPTDYDRQRRSRCNDLRYGGYSHRRWLMNKASCRRVVTSLLGTNERNGIL